MAETTNPSPIADEHSYLGDLHGSARWAAVESVADRGLFADIGVSLGLAAWNEAETIKGRWYQPLQSIIVQRVRPIRYAGERHIITIAPSRSGKGTTAIIPTLLDYPGSVLVIDPKGQNAAVTARRRRQLGHQVVVINPFGLHIGLPWNLPQNKFNPLAAIDPTSDNLVADVTSLCEALIINEGKEPHWTNSARDLVSAIIMHLLTHPDETATLPEMRAILTQPEKQFENTMAEMAKSREPFVAQRARRFQSGSREVQSIISTAIAQTSFLDDPAIAASLSGDDFRFADLKTKPISVFLVLPSRYIAAYARWLRLFVVSAVDSMMSGPKGSGEPVLFVLDEFPALGHLSSVETAMALAAGFGVRLWPVLQDINQAKDIYDSRWETFLANAGVVQVFTPNDLTTADYFSKRCGTKTIRQNVPNSAPHYHSRHLALPQELMGLAPDAAILFLAGLSHPIRTSRLPYYEQAQFRGVFDPDPYHSYSDYEPL